MSELPHEPDATRDLGGSRHLPDQVFLSALETPWLPNERFRHTDHVRLAWLLLRDASLPQATSRAVRIIRRFAAYHHGDEARYHDTITRAFMRLVAAHRALTPEVTTFDDFIGRHPELLDSHLLLRFYSDGVLFGAEARQRWVEPDRLPLPRTS